VQPQGGAAITGNGASLGGSADGSDLPELSSLPEEDAQRWRNTIRYSISVPHFTNACSSNADTSCSRSPRMSYENMGGGGLCKRSDLSVGDVDTF